MSKEIAGYTIYTAQEVMDMPSNPQPCLVDNFIYKGGRTAVVGRPWSGKSWFSLGLGSSIAISEPEFLEHKVTPGRVLYVLFDRRNMVETLHRLNQIQNMETDNFFYVPMQGIALNEPQGFKAFKEVVIGIEPDLTIIDHKSASFAGDENEIEPNRVWTNNLDEVADICGTSYLIVCQAPKNWKTKDISSLPSGHTKLAAWVDTIISIQATGENYRKLQVQSNNADEIEPIIYTKDFQVIDESGAKEARFNKALKLMRELWSVEPIAKKRAAKVSRDVPCGINVAWNAHKEVKLEEMEGTLEIHKHTDSQEE